MSVYNPTVFKKSGGVKFPWPIEDVELTKEQVLTSNRRVKKADAVIAMTEEHKKEWMKCKLDPIYFLKTYGRVVHVDKGLVPLKLYKYQEKMIRNFKNNRFSITLTCRQAGKTTGVVGFLAWFSIFHSEKDCHVLANKEAQAMEIMKRLRRLYEELPYFLQAGCHSFNLGSIALDNGSSVTGHSSSSSAIRGISAALLYIDEMAFLAQDEEFFESTFPTVSSGETSKILITSTPKGARGVFYKLWKGANETDPELHNEFVPLMVLWPDVPGRNELWKQKTINKIGKTKFAQEHECEFLGSSGTLIPNSVLKEMQFKNPLHEFDDGHLKIFYEVEPDHMYVAVSDCAEGVEADSSVCTVFDVTSLPYRTVAKYRSNLISPLLFPYEHEALCRQYNNAWLLIESNNDVGGQVSYITYYEIEYENVITTSIDKKGQGCRVGGVSPKPGVKTSSRVKNIGCANLKTLLERGLLVTEDEEIIDEMGTFVAKGNSYEADDGCNDDCMMTLVLFSWLVKDQWFVEMTKDDMQGTLKGQRDSGLADDVVDFFSTAAELRREEEEAAKPQSLYDFFNSDLPSPPEAWWARPH